jgi:hypothetical protein
MQGSSQRHRAPDRNTEPSHPLASPAGDPHAPVWNQGHGQKLAERMGFEPTIGFPLYALSRGAPSTTRPPLRCGASRGRRMQGCGVGPALRASGQRCDRAPRYRTERQRRLEHFHPRWEPHGQKKILRFIGALPAGESLGPPGGGRAPFNSRRWIKGRGVLQRRVATRLGCPDAQVSDT